MPSSFTIARYRVSDPSLREEIDSHTGSEKETISILRCIERFGGDASIGHFEMTPKPHRGTHHVSRAVSWTVRAVRATEQ